MDAESRLNAGARASDPYIPYTLNQLIDRVRRGLATYKDADQIATRVDAMVAYHSTWAFYIGAAIGGALGFALGAVL